VPNQVFFSVLDRPGSEPQAALYSVMGSQRFTMTAALLAGSALAGCSAGSADEDGLFPPAITVGGTDGIGDGGADDDGDSDDGGDGQSGDDWGDACPAGSACQGGVCVDDQCCPLPQACDTTCCDEGTVCSFGTCVAAGAACLANEDCGAGEFCDFAGAGDVQTAPGCAAGTALEGMCLPRPSACADPEAEDCACEAMPGSNDLTPVLRHEAPGRSYTAPIVIELDDDDCDGLVTATDIPEIAWTAMLGSYTEDDNGEVRVISIVDDVVVDKWTYTGTLPVGQLAGGNIDGVPGNEIVACASDLSVVALDATGNLVWKAAAGTCGTNDHANDFRVSAPAIADLDQDGVPEVVTERAILDGATGMHKATFSATPRGTVAVSDVNGDGWLDIVSGSQAWDRNGQLFADTGNAEASWPAVGDLDGDGTPEIVAIDFDNHRLTVWRAGASGAEVIRGGVDVLVMGHGDCQDGAVGSYNSAGGPPTIGDFDGDGRPDVGLAGGAVYVVFDGPKLMNTGLGGGATVMWATPTDDCSSAQTGSTLFDFDGDGRVEVVYADEKTLYIYDGQDGTVRAEICHRNGTINEYPVVADVDADGKADIVAVSSDNCPGEEGSGALRVFGSASDAWVRTRRVWNQYTYHVTNVGDDGSIPPIEAHNWTHPGLNNFRQNKQPGGEFAAIDAAVDLVPVCQPGGYELMATVTNFGAAPMAPGAQVAFYEGAPPSGVLLGSSTTTLTLHASQSQAVMLALPEAPQSDVYAVVTVPSGGECRTDNNTTPIVEATCRVPG